MIRLLMIAPLALLLLLGCEPPPKPEPQPASSGEPVRGPGWSVQLMPQAEHADLDRVLELVATATPPSPGAAWDAENSSPRVLTKLASARRWILDYPEHKAPLPSLAKRLGLRTITLPARRDDVPGSADYTAKPEGIETVGWPHSITKGASSGAAASSTPVKGKPDWTPIDAQIPAFRGDRNTPPLMVVELLEWYHVDRAEQLAYLKVPAFLDDERRWVSLRIYNGGGTPGFNGARLNVFTVWIALRVTEDGKTRPVVMRVDG